MERKYIGIDLHKASFQARPVGGDGTRLWGMKLARTAEGLVALGVHACAVDPRKTRLKAGVAAKADPLDAGA